MNSRYNRWLRSFQNYSSSEKQASLQAGVDLADRDAGAAHHAEHQQQPAGGAGHYTGHAVELPAHDGQGKIRRRTSDG